MLRAFLTDAAIYGLSTVLSRAISLLLVPIYTRVLTPADYGVADLLGVFSAFAAVTVALEVAQGFARHYSDTTSAEQRKQYASTGLWFTVATNVLFAAVCLVFADWLSLMLLRTPSMAHLFRLAVCATAASGICGFLQNQLRWERRPKAALVVACTGTLVGAAGGIVLVAVAKAGVAGLLIAQLAAAVCIGGLAWYLARHAYSLRFAWTRLGEMLRFSLPLVPSSVCVVASLYVDRVIVANYMSVAAVGLYGLGSRVAAVPAAFMGALQSSLTPLVLSTYREKDSPAGLARVFRFFVLIALPALVCLSLFAPEIVRVFAGAQFREAWRLVPLLAAGALFSQMYVFVPGLGIAKKTVHMAAISISVGVLSLGLNLLLVPRFGVMGAAATSALCGVGMFVLYLGPSQRLYPVPHRWAPMLAAAAVACLAVCAGLWLRARVGVAASLCIRAGLLTLAAAATYLLVWRRHAPGRPLTQEMGLR